MNWTIKEHETFGTIMDEESSLNSEVIHDDSPKWQDRIIVRPI